jgi:magnesium transporter
MEDKYPVLEDDAKEPVTHLIEHRLPWLLLGLLGGLGATFISSQFENLLSKNIRLVFFIPVIVYMADAIGTQTETIYIRNLAKKQIKFLTYLVKELLTGIALGSVFGLILGIFTYIWLNSFDTALTVGLAMLANASLAPVVALIIPEILQKERTDPALGAGPFTTIVQDIASLLIYFLIATVILFK